MVVLQLVELLTNDLKVKGLNPDSAVPGRKFQKDLRSNIGSFHFLCFRNVLDTMRTMVIWAFSLAFGWQKFHYLQVNSPAREN